ncbi:sigma-70 family RNA polymerase sigma factor [Alicyclobacillus mengziensis]|uniref:Sigma-70 family RNA polymerase sigma factor n=1 Tax=Alicyclobacillus mengziensis TaxID=2931921 RepID=A0A9X7W0D9_9BACL|nr:sigma-70 family RNA polymerase sigma factor [Alicyclobacillus mengziensis]QSO48142.1 sigma-70 family RNA polymerase sigma factor [Alicyclobacillus mengziensis]
MGYFDYKDYAVAVARRFIRYRRSAMIDESDLVNTAMVRLWELESQRGELDEQTARRTIRFSMLDAVRSSSIVRTPRNVNMRQAIQAYQQISTISPRDEPRFSPVDEWVEEEPVRQVWLIVEGLPQEDRLLLSLIWEQGCSIQEAADVLYLSKSQVFRRYQDILKRIKSQILIQKRKATR